jgi:hypothetical protein
VPKVKQEGIKKERSASYVPKKKEEEREENKFSCGSGSNNRTAKTEQRTASKGCREQRSWFRG